MGTRVSFYVNRIDWVGSANFAWSPDELPDQIREATTEAAFRAAVLSHCPKYRDRLEDPWSRFDMADYLYSFDVGRIFVGEDFDGKEYWTPLNEWSWSSVPDGVSGGS